MRENRCRSAGRNLQSLSDGNDVLYRDTTTAWAILCADNGAVFSWQENPKRCDRNEELKRRLQMYAAGEVHNLIGRVLVQQNRQQAATKKKAKPQRLKNNEESALVP